VYIPTELTQRKIQEQIHNRFCRGDCTGTWGAGEPCQVHAAFLLGQIMPEISKEMFPVVRKDERARISEKIIGELVCCDLEAKISDAYSTGAYDSQVHSPYSVAQALGLDWHDMCYYGGWAATIAEGPGAATPGV